MKSKGKFTQREKAFFGIIFLWIAIAAFGYFQATKAAETYESTIERLQKEYIELQASTKNCIRMLGECRQENSVTPKSDPSVIE